MNIMSKALTSLLCLLALTACATVNGERSLSPQISHPPAIDVPLSAVVDNVKDNIGVSVRWGGQIIQAEDIEKPGAEGQEGQLITRLTVVAQPLLNNGKLDWRDRPGFKGGRFIVEMSDFDDQISRRFITVYGPISGAETLSNGKRKITIPVVTAIGSADWNYPLNRNRFEPEFRHGLPYNGLGFRYGYYDGFGYYGGAYYGSRFGLYPFYYPYRYYPHGHRIGRRGH